MATFEQIPEILERMEREISALRAQMSDLHSKLADGTTAEPVRTVCGGLFRADEIIKAGDKRLYKGKNAPFGSLAAIYRVINNPESGVLFTVPAGKERGYVTTGAALEKYLENRDLRQKYERVRL